MLLFRITRGILNKVIHLILKVVLANHGIYLGWSVANFLFFRDRDGLRVYNVLCHWSHLVQDAGRHLTCTKVSTTHEIHCIIILNFPPSTSFLVLSFTFLHLFLCTFSDNFFISVVFAFFPPIVSILTTFLFLCPFFFRFFSPSNANLQLSICLLPYSVSIASPLCFSLPSYQTNVLDLQKSTFP